MSIYNNPTYKPPMPTPVMSINALDKKPEYLQAALVNILGSCNIDQQLKAIELLLKYY